MSPGSKVVSLLMSATMSAKPKSRSVAASASWASSPFTQVLTRMLAGSTARASSSRGPSGV